MDVDLDDIKHWQAVGAVGKVAAFGVLLAGKLAEEYNRLCVRMHGVKKVRLTGELNKLGFIDLNPTSKGIANDEEARLRLALALTINTSKVGPLGAEASAHLALLTGAGQWSSRGVADDVADGIHNGVKWIQDTAADVYNGAADAITGAWKSVFHSLDKDPRELPSILMGEPVSNLGVLSAIPRPLDEPRGIAPAAAAPAAAPAGLTVGEIALLTIVGALAGGAAAVVTYLGEKLIDTVFDKLGLSDADKKKAKDEADDLLVAAEPTDGFQPGAASGESLRALNEMLDAITGQSTIPKSPSAENLAAQSAANSAAASSYQQSAEPPGAAIVLPAIASALAFKVI